MKRRGFQAAAPATVVENRTMVPKYHKTCMVLLVKLGLVQCNTFRNIQSTLESERPYS